MNIQDFKEKLVATIASVDVVKGIGQTGDMNAPLIPKQSDIDLFVICTEIPSKEQRLNMYRELRQECSELNMEVCNGGVWGYGDIFIFNEIDVMPMYFTMEEMESYLNEVLQGKHLGKDGRFYPIGRLASIESLNILYEQKGAWTRIQEKVKVHSESLFQKWYQDQIGQVLDDEDLSRVMLRKEVLFYHQVLEEALDHLLQALYAVNNCYFPSRKRTQEALDTFQLKPQDYYSRLLSIIVNASKMETIEDSVRELRLLTEEITILGKRVFR